MRTWGIWVDQLFKQLRLAQATIPPKGRGNSFPVQKKFEEKWRVEFRESGPQKVDFYFSISAR